MKRLLLISIIGISLLSLEASMSVTPYMAKNTYSPSSSKSDLSVYGVYSYIGLGQSALEWSMDSFVQNDIRLQRHYTVAYSRFHSLSYSSIIGAHLVQSDYDVGNSSIAFIGGTYYPSTQFNVSLIGYYGNHEVDTDGTQLTTQQVTGTFTHYSSNLSFPGYLTSSTRLTTIWASSSLGFPKPNLSSVGYTLTYYLSPFTFFIDTWVGNELYANTANGFIVYNSPELYKNGMTGSMSLSFNSSISLIYSYSKTQFLELGSTSLKNAYKSMLMIKLLF